MKELILIDCRLSDIAKYLGSSLIGNDIRIDGFNLCNRDIIADNVLSYCGAMQFVRIATRKEKVKALIIPQELYSQLDSITKDRFSFILSDTPEWSFYKAFSHLIEEKKYPQYNWPTDLNGAKVQEGAIVENGVIIGKNVVIGNNSVIKSGTIIGDNVTIGSCSVVGSEGFQLIKDDQGNSHTIPHVGRTYIGDNVSIGDNVTISKSIFEGYTILDDYVKIDSQAHIAHNCIVGNNSVICANTTLLGSCSIGNDVWVAPNCLIMNRVKVGNGAFICASSFVMGNVLPKSKMFGVPAKKVE